MDINFSLIPLRDEEVRKAKNLSVFKTFNLKIIEYLVKVSTNKRNYDLKNLSNPIIRKIGKGNKYYNNMHFNIIVRSYIIQCTLGKPLIQLAIRTRYKENMFSIIVKCVIMIMCVIYKL